MGHNQSCSHQSSVAESKQPGIEDLLKDALKPFDLKDAHTHIQCLQKLVKDDNYSRHLQPHIQQLKETIEFLKKLESYSTKEKRNEWYRSTYSRKMQSHPGVVRSENSQLKKDLKKCQDEAEDLEREKNVTIESLESENSRLEKVVSDRETELEDLQHKFSDFLGSQKNNDELERELQRTQQEKSILKNKCAQLQKQLDEANNQIRGLSRHVKDLSDRLAEEMNTKVSRDEDALENVNIKNRPLKIVEEYQLFQSNIWLTAKEQLDHAKIPNLKAMKILVETLMDAETDAYEQHQMVQNAIYQAISLQGDKAPTPIDFKDVDLKKKLDTFAVRKIPDGVKIGIGDFLRRNADSADVSLLTEKINKQLIPKVNKCIRRNTQEVRGGEVFSIEKLNLQQYVEESARLAWKMTLQRPPMSFDFETGVNQKWRGEKKQDVFFGSSDPTKKGNVVKFYVRPALMHGDTLMSKGMVYVGEQ